MTTEGRNLYIRQGVLRVHAQGYWYSGGGEKGAFGYYPHLKDERGLPVYPDTQIKGDLAFACHWLAALRETGDQQKLRDTAELIASVFGEQGKEYSSPLYLTDLTLTPESRKRWQDKRFEVKTRIAVEDDRTVEEHMLVSFEYAFLDGLTLEADLFLAYFDDPEKLEKATAFLTEAAGLLSGFGAFRSRGYGWGRIEMDWQRHPLFKIDAGEETAPASRTAFFFTARNHVRNRILDPEGTQLIPTRRSLAAAQIRSWLAKSYHALYGAWPTPQEMKDVKITDFHPTFGHDLSYIPPRTTLRTETEDKSSVIVKDLAKDQPDKGKEDREEESQENLVQAKTKPLGDNFFVTDTPKVLEIRTAVRFRNVMAAPGDFRTREEGGLFAQEYLPAGIRFGGIITFTKPDSRFAARCRHLLAHLPPTIAGTIFTVQGIPLTATESTGAYHLLTADIPYQPEIVSKSGNSIALTSRRGFNTANGRPRRQRLVIAAGAVLSEPVRGKTIAWKGFGNPQLPLCPRPPKTTGTVATDNDGRRRVAIPPDLKNLLHGISRSQGNQWRELLHPRLTADFLRDFLQERLAKYDQWNPKDNKVAEHLLPRKLLEELRQRLNARRVDMEELRAYIKEIYQEMQRGWWEKKKKERGGRQP